MGKRNIRGKYVMNELPCYGTDKNGEAMNGIGTMFAKPSILNSGVQKKIIPMDYFRIMGIAKSCRNFQSA